MINKTSFKLIMILSLLCIAAIPIVNAQFLEQNGQMNATYTYTGTFIDADTGAIIQAVTVSDNLGFTTTAATGTFSNSYQYGSVTFTSTATNYASTTTAVLIDSNIVQNISMAKATGSNQISYFTPHKVRFMCRDFMGAPIVDMGVSVYGVQTTLGSIDWVANLFGINLDSTPILTTLMSGTTGNDGSIVFILVETEKYQVRYVKQSAGINETRYYYPKQEEYDEIFWTEIAPVSSAVIDYGFQNSTTNASYVTLGITYNDTLASTTSLEFYIDNSTGERLWNQTYTNVGNLTASHDMPKITGGGYFWGINAISSNYAKPLTPSRYYAFEERRWLIDPMKAGEAGANPILAQTAAVVYNWSAVILILIFGLAFGRASVKMGVMVVALMGALFKFIGWLDTTWLLISLAMGLAIMFYFRYSEEEG